MSDRAICDRIYQIIKSESPEYAYTGARILLKRDLLSYTYSFLDLVINSIYDEKGRFEGTSKSLPQGLPFDIFFNKKGGDLSWNRAIFILDSEAESCHISYEFDSELNDKIQEFKQYLKDIAWRDKFTQGYFKTSICNELIDKRGVDEEVADEYLAMILSYLASNIKEKWQIASLILTKKPATVDARYINISNEEKKLQFHGDLCMWSESNLEKTFKNYEYWDNMMGIKWNRAEFQVNFDGEFSIKFITLI